MSNESFPRMDPYDWRYAESPDIPEPVYLGATIYMVIIGIFGIFSNGSVILAFLRGSPEVRSPFNLVLMNVIFNEFVVSVYGIPVDLTCISMRGYHLGFGTCIATGFILTTAGMTSLYTLMGLSIERWLIITRPGKFSLNSSTTTSLILASSWILSLLSSAPPLFGWAYYAPETSGMSCAPAWEDPDNINYTWYLMIIGFIIPLAIILFTSLSVIYNLHKHSRSLLSNINKSHAKQKERRASLMVILMIVAFMISWFPYAIVCFVKMAGYEVTPTVSSIPLLFAKSSICWNPVIYVILNDQFRNALLPSHALRSTLTRIQTSASRMFPSQDSPNNNLIGNRKIDGPLVSENHLSVPQPDFGSKTTQCMDDQSSCSETLNSDQILPVLQGADMGASGKPYSSLIFKASPFRRQLKAVIFERGENGEPTVTVIMTRDQSKPAIRVARSQSCDEVKSDSVEVKVEMKQEDEEVNVSETTESVIVNASNESSFSNSSIVLAVENLIAKN